VSGTTFACPVCGWEGLTTRPYASWDGGPLAPDLTPPYEDVLGTPSYEVCPCCGFEFGNDDNPGTADPISFERYRQQWLSEGAPWFDPSIRPVGWSPPR
jgi:hypothetical protein